MPGSASAGTALGVPKNPTSVAYHLPKIGELIQRKFPHKDLKHPLMIAFGTDFNKLNIEGEVIAQDGKGKTTRIRWRIGQSTYDLDHGKAFFKVKEAPPPPPGGGRTSASGQGGGEGEEEEEQEGGRAGPRQDDESDSEEEEGSEVPGGDGLKCKLLGEEVQWKFLENGVTECSRAARGVRETEPSIKWFGDASDNGTRTVLQALEQAIPMDFFLKEEGALGWTNDSLPNNVPRFSQYEFVQCLGVLQAKCLVEGPLKDLWKTADNGLLRPFALGERFGLSRNRFLDWVKYLKLCPANAPDTKAKRIEHFINAFNKHRMKGFSAGSGIVLDESISAFRPFFDNTPEGIGWLVKMIRKPKGVGAELKNAACAVTGVMLFLELQEGKDEMAAKEFCEKFPKHAALVLRLTKQWHGKAKVIYADSYFASLQTVKACMLFGLDFVGPIKNACAGFPKKFMHNGIWLLGEQPNQRGDWRAIELVVTINDVERRVCGFAWNEPGTQGVPKKVLIASCGTTLPTDPHIKKRWCVNDDTGLTTNITRHVPRPLIVKQYFEAACGIDVHNHLRQGVMGIEEHIGTKDHIFRLFTTIFGMCVVDAFKFYYMANTQMKPQGLKKFIEAAALAFLTNRYDGCAGLPLEGRRLRKRGADAMLGDDDEDASDSVVHAIITRREWHGMTKGRSNVRESAIRHGAHGRCQVQGCGEECYYVCVACSKERGKAFGVCGPKTGRNCAQAHAVEASLD